ncbi:hypothetical protein DFH09DRAFT_1386968 [Mycena vulgaris]|nr:hypothetical protein DFH09DRAFT_1386968 [Mycena vulgaris]
MSLVPYVFLLFTRKSLTIDDTGCPCNPSARLPPYQRTGYPVVYPAGPHPDPATRVSDLSTSILRRHDELPLDVLHPDNISDFPYDPDNRKRGIFATVFARGIGQGTKFDVEDRIIHFHDNYDYHRDVPEWGSAHRYHVGPRQNPPSLVGSNGGLPNHTGTMATTNAGETRFLISHSYTFNGFAFYWDGAGEAVWTVVIG